MNIVQATYQFGGAHFSQIGNLGHFVETVLADEGFLLCTECIGNVLRVNHL